MISDETVQRIYDFVVGVLIVFFGVLIALRASIDAVSMILIILFLLILLCYIVARAKVEYPSRDLYISPARDG